MSEWSEAAVFLLLHYVGRKVVGCWLFLSPARTMIIIPVQLIITRVEFHQQHPSIMLWSNLSQQSVSRPQISVVSPQIHIIFVLTVFIALFSFFLKFLFVKLQCCQHQGVSSHFSHHHMTPSRHPVLSLLPSTSEQLRRKKKAHYTPHSFSIIKIQYENLFNSVFPSHLGHIKSIDGQWNQINKSRVRPLFCVYYFFHLRLYLHLSRAADLQQLLAETLGLCAQVNEVKG